MSTPPTSRSMLIVLDGFGIGKDSPFNAIANAKMPFYTGLLKKYPHSQLVTHGEAVGLPPGIMGNSEVGHMTMGAGRIIYQDLMRINRSISDKSFFKNPVLTHALQAGASTTGRVHLMGLLSDGGVHSHMDHLWALLDLCVELRIPNISVHPFLDGRDTPPDSSIEYLQTLLKHPAFTAQTGSKAVIATVMGRYWAMDRDKRWERTARALDALLGKISPAPSTTDVIQAVHASHCNGKTDEFVEPVLLDPSAAMKDGDSVVFFNFRSDRARQITEKLICGQHVRLSAFAGMTQYDKNFSHPVAFDPQSHKNIFAEILENHQKKQFRIAETEKYAHVTFFFNAGREARFQGEDRLLIPSPKDVPTYDLKPEMSARQVAEAAAERVGQYDFILMNFANPDMVGHTGNYPATVQAMQALDPCLEKVIGTAERAGYHVIVTADHGNAEEMQDCNGKPHTQHTLNPVPALWISPGSAISPKSARKALRDGTLADIMPTLCNLMNLPIPKEVTGKSLL